jgi:hypothetical protein
VQGKRFPEEARVDLSVDGRTVATYVAHPEVDPRRGPRPYLHPVRTLAGTVVTDVLPEDHPHHLGVSVALQDVNGVNLWGGRTYVRGQGYTWLENHSVIEHLGFGRSPRTGSRPGWAGATPPGTPCWTRTRVMTARPVSGDAWRLDVTYTLRNPTGQTVRLGSPGTNGTARQRRATAGSSGARARVSRACCRRSPLWNRR